MTEQNATKSNNPRLFDSLNEDCQAAVMLLYGGFTYQRIAKEIKRPYSTIRRWFMTGGICQPAYDELHKMRGKTNHHAFKKIDRKFQVMAIDALETLHQAVLRGDWRAAESLLDRAGFAPTQRIKQVVETKDDTQDAALLIQEGRDYVRDLQRQLENTNQSLPQ